VRASRDVTWAADVNGMGWLAGCTLGARDVPTRGQFVKLSSVRRTAWGFVVSCAFGKGVFGGIRLLHNEAKVDGEHLV
jgi:hypothetical protein